MSTSGPTLIMGVINVTPDSFSDGGEFLDAGAAVARAESLVADGADILDVGAETTRPGAAPLDESEEWRRLEPVLRRLASLGLGARISVDTRKPALMLKAADLGVTLINDVQGGADDDTLKRLAAYPQMAYLAMHMHGTPQTMQKSPLSGRLAPTAVEEFFNATHARLRAAGFHEQSVWLDPGIGFGKTDAGNARTMAMIPRWRKKYQIAIGISRKSFIGRTLGITEPKERDDASKMLEFGLVLSGARMVRTHDVSRLRGLLNLLYTNDQP